MSGSSPAGSPAPGDGAGPTRLVSWHQLRLVGALLATVLVAELGARAIAPQLPPLITGDGIEMELKADQLRAAGNLPAAEQPQVVFFGNSMTDAGVSPEVFAATSTRWDRAYNAALIGAPMSSQGRWAEDHVLAHITPEVVVLGVSPLDLLDVNPLDLLDIDDGGGRNNAVEAAFDATLDQLSPSLAAEMFAPVEDVSVLVQHRGSLRSPRMVWSAIRATVDGDPVREGIPQVATVEGGEVVPRDQAFWERSVRPTGGTGQFHGRRLDVTRDSDLEQRLGTAALEATFLPDRLRRLIAAVDGDRRVIVVAPPIAVETLRAVPGAVERLADIGRSMAEEAEAVGAEMVDMTAAPYPLSDFADVSHLNRVGSERFSADLARAIEGLG